MDHVIHEMQDSKSFKDGSGPEKHDAPQGTDIVASSHSPTHAAVVPDRDGGSTASTSDSDDV